MRCKILAVVCLYRLSMPPPLARINVLSEELLDQAGQHFRHLLVHLLPLDLESIEDIRSRANRNLILSIRQPGPNLINEFLQRHSNQVTILQIGLVLSIVQLGLDSRRINFQHLHITRTIAQLGAQSKNEMMQSRLGCTIVRAAHHGHESHLGSSESESSLVLLLLEMRDESLGETDGGGMIGDQFLVEDVQVDGLWLGEVEGALDARVDEDAV